MTALQERRVRRLENELRARRDCLVGAKQTLESVRDTLKQAEDLDLARVYLAAPVDERIELVDLAIEQTDDALK